MPSWFTRKSKCKSKSKSIPVSPVNPNPDPKLKRPDKKEKANSFDKALVRRPLNNGSGNGFGSGHPLPRPVSSPLPSIPHLLAAAGSGSASASASGSSVSSLGSDETPDLGVFRCAEPINMPKCGNMLTPDPQRQQLEVNKVSPKKEFLMFNVDAVENNFNSGNCMRGHHVPTSPIHPLAQGKFPGSPRSRQDDGRSPLHPLPLPPRSPGSSFSARSVPSQWKKGKLVGRGTFGHVYLGFNSESGQMCAIKEVEVISNDSNSKECLRQLNQEITLLSQFSHPNIVQYFGSELADETLSVYLEYVSGGSIHKLLQEYGPFKEPVIRSYTRQILSGLAYLHGRNTIHRDIKGANVLVDPNGEVKLADFGMAKHIAAYSSVRSFKGSPYWMAPEVIMNNNGYNLSADIWSLGCTVLEMATSKPPWSQFQGVPAMFKIANSKDIPDIPDHLSSDAKSFMKLCLQRDPSARPTAAQLMDHPFVRGNAWTKVTKSSMFRDMLPPLADGNHRMGTMELSSNRSISPLRESTSLLRDRDYGLGPTAGFPSSSRNQSDILSMRMNMSLPVSPCSSPLRQFKQYNRSCLPSPPHPPYTTGTINYGRDNYSFFPSRPIMNFDPLIEISQPKLQTPYGSPRRR